MITIYKFTFKVEDHVTLAIPGFNRLLKVGVGPSAEFLYAWALVATTESQDRTVKLRMFGTGHPIPVEELSELIYFDTVQDHPFVWHVFVQNT